MNLTPTYNFWSVPPKLWCINILQKIGGQSIHTVWEGSLHPSCHHAFKSWGGDREERTRVLFGFSCQFCTPFPIHLEILSEKDSIQDILSPILLFRGL